MVFASRFLTMSMRASSQRLSLSAACSACSASSLVLVALLLGSAVAQQQPPSPFASADVYGLSDQETQQLLNGFVDQGGDSSVSE